MRLEYSPQSVEDLLDIASYIARDNPARALTFVEALEAACERLQAQPGVGAPRPHLGEGVRVLPHGRYLIFHVVRGAVVRIERVLHSARDITQLHDADPSESA